MRRYCLAKQGKNIMATITYENAESFYGIAFYGKSSGDTIHIIGKTKTSDGEAVILLDNRRFVTVKGFNMQYMPKSEFESGANICYAVNAKYTAEIKKIGAIVNGNNLRCGITFKIGKKYFRADMSGGAVDFEIRITPLTYTKEVVRVYANGIERHLAVEFDQIKTKKLHRKNFEKTVGVFKNEKDFADKFFAKFGFLGLV
jgi:hypothetical protein